MWRKGNLSALLVGMQTGTVTVENSMEFPLKIKKNGTFYSAIPLLGLYPKNPKTPIQKNLCTPMFIAAQFTIVKCWKQPECPSVNEWIKKYGIFTQCNTYKSIYDIFYRYRTNSLKTYMEP